MKETRMRVCPNLPQIFHKTFHNTTSDFGPSTRAAWHLTSHTPLRERGKRRIVLRHWTLAHFAIAISSADGAKP